MRTSSLLAIRCLAFIAAVVTWGWSFGAHAAPCSPSGPCISETGPDSCRAPAQKPPQATEENVANSRPSVPLCSDTATSDPAPAPFSGSDFGRIEQGPNGTMVWLSLKHSPDDERSPEPPSEAGDRSPVCPQTEPSTEPLLIRALRRDLPAHAGFPASIERPPRG